MAEVIKIYQNKLKDCATAFKIYLKKLEYSGFFGVEPLLASTIEKNIEDILTDSDVTKGLNSEPTIETCFKVANLLSAFYESLRSAHEIFYKHRLDITKQGTRTSSGSTMSYSYLTDLNESLQDITDIFQAVGSADRPDIFEVIGYTVKNLDDLEKCKKQYEHYLKNKSGQNVIDLYSYILQKSIDNYTGLPEGKPIIKQITKDVEALKTLSLLEIGVEPRIKVPDQNTIQKLLQKFNLVPDYVDRPLEDLMKEINAEADSGGVDFKKTAKMLSALGTQKFGFIIIYKILPRPIFHNLWTLVSKEYLEKNDLLQAKSVGINSKVLQRSRTIEFLPLPKSKKSDLADRVEVVNDSFDEDESKNFYYIIETIDGQNFHFLLPWHTSTKYMPASWIDITKAPSVRVSAYNNALSPEVVSFLQEPFMEIPRKSRSEVRSEETSWSNLRQKIAGSTLSWAKYELSKLIDLNLGVWTKFLSSSGLHRKIVKDIVDEISANTGAIKSLDNSAQVNSEVFISYFRDIDKIWKQVKHDLVDIYKREFDKKVDVLFSETMSENKLAYTRNKMLDIFREILLIVLEKHINRRSNIYLTISKKIELLNKTL